jgi:hypothetical protein
MPLTLKFSCLQLSTFLVGLGLFATVHAQTPAQNAQSAGFAAAQTITPNDISNKITTNKATEYIPGFSTNTTPPTRLTGYASGNSLAGPGATRNVECNGIGYQSNNSMDSGECNASITLRQNTNKATFAPNDPIARPGTTVKINEVLGSDVGSNNCTTRTVTTPSVEQNRTCTEAITSYNVTCSKSFIPQLTTASTGFTQNPGYEVGQYSARTYNYNVNLDGFPSQVMLTYYRVDNYGQLFVNGNVVQQNLLGGMTDTRNGSVGTSAFDDGDGGYYYQTSFTNADGSSTPFYDDNCNRGCRGYGLNDDITRFFRPGNNTITLVCVNASSIGPCTFNMSMNSQPIAPPAWNNGCGPLEALQ